MSTPETEPQPDPNAEAEKPTVVVALARVMADVQAIGKEQRNISQNYNFRGIDAVINAVGPALREHGVIVVPTSTSWNETVYDTKNGARMRNMTVTVGWRFYGPRGDFIDAETVGEAADAGDKATPKAHSVAYRVLLLQALCIPTNDPDPDSESHERSTGGASSTPRGTGRVQSPQGTPMPAGWEPMEKMLRDKFGGGAVLDFTVFADQLAQVLYSVSVDDVFALRDPKQLTSDQWQQLGLLLAQTVVRLVDGDTTDGFPPPGREAFVAAFKPAADGQELAGPPWKMAPDETDRQERPDQPAAETSLPVEDEPAGEYA